MKGECYICREVKRVSVKNRWSNICRECRRDQYWKYKGGTDKPYRPFIIQDSVDVTWNDKAIEVLNRLSRRAI